jgi:hypothetical protein
MDPQKITYDICRSYLADNKGTMRDEFYQKLCGYLRSRDIARLATCTTLTCPALSTQDEYKALMQVEAFFKKNKSFSDETSCRASAMSSFNRGERICRITNRRLDHYFFQRGRLDPDLERWMVKLERIVSSTLGPYRTFFENIPKLVRVTAGATSTKSRRRSLPHLRISKRPYASPACEPYLSALSQYFGYGKIKVRPTFANRVEFVPKNWKTYRTIACEPEGNVFLQLAFDAFVKRRLRSRGINLRSQFRNQELARVGSVDGSFATIDLSMASDTLSFNAVAWLLPRSWFNFVRDVRSSHSRGEVSVEYAKFSSMGNGCTFGLETLVFASACRAVGSKVSVVYGDDIVIETELVPDLLKLLKFLGFITNTDKSHFTGPFRESCGANWYAGTDITPIYVREIDRRKAMICHLVNSLMTITYPGEKLWELLLSLIREHKLPLSPFSENSTAGIWVNSPTARRTRNIRSKHGMQYAQSYVPVAAKHCNRDSRSLFLWYLDTLEKGRPPHVPRNNDKLSTWYLRRYRGDDESVVPVSRSRYTSSSHRFRRKWVHWREPAVGAPDQLDCWSESVFSLIMS